MEIRTGVDIIEIDRIKKSLSNPRFLDRLFGCRERECYRASGRPTLFAAGNFCAKEAFSKALGTGIRGFSLAEVEVLRDSLGKPYLRLSGNAKQLAQNLEFDVSISHCRQYAVATVIAYRRQKEDNG